MTPLRRLSTTVAAVQDEDLEKLAIGSRVKARLLGSDFRSVRRTPRWTFGVLLLPVAAALLLCFWLWPSPKLSYAVGISQSSAPVGAWLAAPLGEELPLHFSDRSTVTLGSESRARVAELGATQVRLALEAGQARVSVVHHRGRRWQVRAGPFDVTVSGTTFEVRWDPQGQRLDVHTVEGRVEVAAEGFVGRGVSAGETLRVAREGDLWRVREAPLRGETRAPTSAAAPLPSAESGTPAPAAAPLPSAESGTPAPAAAPLPSAESGTPGAEAQVRDEHEGQISPPRRASGHKGSYPPPHEEEPEATTWRELATAGHYREAFDRVERSGFEATCRTASLPDLLMLAETARFAGRIDRAKLALTVLRDRFRGDPGASVAAFSLGRMEFDSARDFGSAATWFRTYLREQPSGQLAREAAGRLVEALERGGDHVQAQHSAKDYLARYPKGPHAALARKIAGE